MPGCRWKTIFPGPDCKPFQISVESEAVKIKGKYLSKDVTTLNFNNKLSANLSWNTRTAVTPLCIFNSLKINLGGNDFSALDSQSASFQLIEDAFASLVSGSTFLLIMKVAKVYQKYINFSFASKLIS